MAGDDMTITVAADLEDYQSFYDQQWTDELLAITRETKIDRAAIDLTTSFAGQSMAHEMPFRMISTLQAFLKSMFRERAPFPLEISMDF
jgi:hypothetical protein